MKRLVFVAAALAWTAVTSAQAPQPFDSSLILSLSKDEGLAQGGPDWPKLEEETMRHYQALLRFDTSDPPGKELPAAA